MRLAQRTLLIVLPAMLLATIAIYLLGLFFIEPNFRKLEQQRAQTNLERVLKLIEMDFESLTSTAEDWGYWDDTHEYLRSRDPAYVADNLQPASQISLRVQLIALYDRQGRRAWARALNLNSAEEFELPPFNRSSVTPTFAMLNHNPSPRVKLGMMGTERGPMLLVSVPVLDSNRGGAMRGTLIVGRLLDRQRLDVIAERSLSEVRLLAGPKTDEALMLASETATGFPRTRIDFRIEGEKLVASMALIDLAGRPAAHLEVLTARETELFGRDSLRTTAVFIGVAMCLLALALLLLLQRGVIRPLALLTAQADIIAHNPEQPHRLHLQRSDEIGALSQSLDRMLDRLADTRKHLLDQSYRSGASQLAGGVIEDLRKSLQPIRDHIEQPLRLLDRSQTSGQQMLLQQLGEANLPRPRQTELLQLLQDQVLEQSSLLSEARGELRSLRKHVDGMQETIAEYARFIGGTRVVEPVAVALPPLIDHALQILPQPLRQALDLQVDVSVLRADPAWAPREVLQQIINVLIQRTSLALLKSPAGHGNLRISVDAARSGGQQIALRFDDDRPTPSPEAMQQLFGSDDSEPGLTLAWAQDATAGIGGQLSAEAAHPFDGLILQLRLPKRLKDATPRGVVDE